MLGLSITQSVLWAATSAMEAALLALLVLRKQYREFPFFSAYILAILLQSAALFLSYSYWGFDTLISSRIAWISQGVVILVRGLVVMELCRSLVGPYRGVWALTWRVLLVCATIVLSYSLLGSKFSISAAIVNADRGLELTIATVVVVVFLFASYYGIIAQARIQFLAAGLCLYSCFSVINDSLLERWLKSFSNVWNFMAAVCFLANLALWFWAFSRPATTEVSRTVLLPRETYRLLSPQLNLQLRQLNDRLSLFWQSEEPRP
jgi:hypothetical protein